MRARRCKWSLDLVLLVGCGLEEVVCVGREGGVELTFPTWDDFDRSSSLTTSKPPSPPPRPHLRLFSPLSDMSTSEQKKAIRSRFEAVFPVIADELLDYMRTNGMPTEAIDWMKTVGTPATYPLRAERRVQINQRAVSRPLAAGMASAELAGVFN